MSDAIMCKMVVPFSEFKIATSGEVTAYANTKNFIDHAMDRSVEGCYVNSIEKHRKNGTIIKMFWGHDSWELPVGGWHHAEEDSKGLLLVGKMSKFGKGPDIKGQAEEGFLDSFSIGYRTIKEVWNHELKCNDLIELDIRETSWVNFACNEESLLQGMKNHLSNGELPTKRELQKLLQGMCNLSETQSSKIIANYNPKIKEKTLNIKEIVAELELFK